MIFKQYISEGLAHYSYLIADQGQAAIIDPRRDIEIYLQEAAGEEAHINHVFETHRNEDYLIGSVEIQAATGAKVFHADSQWEYQYGTPSEDGQAWMVGRLKIEAIHTPGHTPGSLSYLLYDTDGNPWVLFSGDTLFSGDAGRVDLLGEDCLEEMGGLLYDSILNKILPLGDSIILCPAHGAGSVCGSGIAERTWTTIGMERKHNPKLQVNSKHEFIDLHAKVLERPPYFRKMEELNLAGPPVLGVLGYLEPLNPGNFKKAMINAQIVDTRDQLSFGGGHIPGSLAMLERLLPSFAGWFLNYEKPILFICNPEKTENIHRIMVRLGFDNLSGYLRGGMMGWTLAGYATEKIPTIDVEAFCQMVQSDGDPFLLDIRGEDELTGGGLRHGKLIHLTELFDHLDEIPRGKPVFPLCRSGNRAMIAASLLKREGWEDVSLLMGGLGAWNGFDCDFEL